MTILTIAQLGISLFGCAAFLLVTRDTRRAQVAGVVCGLISNPFWWLMVIATEQWLTVPLHLAYTYGWLSKAYRLWKSQSPDSIDIKLTGVIAYSAARLQEHEREVLAARFEAHDEWKRALDEYWAAVSRMLASKEAYDKVLKATEANR